jgi:hypothetical protein
MPRFHHWRRDAYPNRFSVAIGKEILLNEEINFNNLRGIEGV